MTPRAFATVVFLFGIFIGSHAATQGVLGDLGQPPRANEAETQLVLDHFGLESTSADDREEILSIDAYRWSDSEPYELAGFVWLEPVFARGAICIAHEFASLGRPNAQGYTWEDQERYHHWLVQSESECVLDNSSELPQSVVTWGPIASDAMIQILEAEQDLVELTLDRSDPAEIGSLSGDWRIERISLSRLDSEFGISYQARFRQLGRARGPSCTFTIVDGEIQILSVGFWLA